MLNNELGFCEVAPNVLDAFLGRNALVRLLFAGTKLYKHTDQPLLRPDGTFSPWWALAEPNNPDDPGLAGEVERAEGLGASTADFARARFAVTKQWNSMSNLMLVELLVPAYCLYGRCAAQRVDASEGKVVFIGGGCQIWIPNLTIAHVRAA